MLWRSDNRKIYVLHEGGTWQQFDDTWNENQPTYSCGVEQSPPTPVRGFGKLWCNQSSVRQSLGDAVETEWADRAAIQEFVGGLIFLVSEDAYVLPYDGAWK